MNEGPIISIVLVVLAWAGSGLITWGVMKGKMEEFERRLDEIEEDSKGLLPRIEYDNRHADLVRLLTRIEDKLDRELRHEN